ncbi:hypothetical protein Pint_16439 [Pistacia integerrima]|uniref:Uncharacterized protein n=1 Tax=Pistacia integerrima TaxID=434235 RepID=A0ACC0ZBB1_9ROSI|nr:hypothetical protein Pint_16439 [Pistacia integerrima]
MEDLDAVSESPAQTEKQDDKSKSPETELPQPPDSNPTGLCCKWKYGLCKQTAEYRTKLRKKFNLAERPALDWVTHLYCHWCALCQEYRELQSRGFDPSLGNFS